jgi:adenine deaminase
VVIPEKIITGREIVQSDSKSVCRLTVLERHGKGLKPSNAYAVGFGEQFDGAIASSVGHDSHNLIAAGKSTRDLGVAFEHLKKMGGGFCVVQNETVIADLALPIGGLMSASGSDFISEKLKLLREASKAVHCELHEPFLQLAFLSLPVIPTLKLTDLGLVDVEAFKFIEVKA